jgi:hypothetical protein
VTPVLSNENATAAMDKIMKIMYITRKGTHKNITKKILHLWEIQKWNTNK